jgi:hypothetical protein
MKLISQHTQQTLEDVMKTTTMVLTAAIMLATAIPAMAGQTDVIVENLLTGLSTDNAGLQRSSAFKLGELRSDAAVIPLMALLHNNENEDVRIAAAWALCQIGDARGTFAVKQAVTFDDSKKVRATCAWYYETYVHPGTFKFSQTTHELFSTENQ